MAANADDRGQRGCRPGLARCYSIDYKFDYGRQAAMTTSPVRVKARTHSLLKRMAQHQRRPISDVLDDAVERYRRAQLFEAADVAYRRAERKKDRELDAWENALADGLAEA